MVVAVVVVVVAAAAIAPWGTTAAVEAPLAAKAVVKPATVVAAAEFAVHEAAVEALNEQAELELFSNVVVEVVDVVAVVEGVAVVVAAVIEAEL